MASKPTQTIPNLENATPGYLVDEITKIRVEQSRLTFLEGVYKEALKARITPEQRSGDKGIEGEYAFATYRAQTQERVDTAAVKEYFKDQPEELRKVMKVIKFDVLTTKPKVATEV